MMRNERGMSSSLQLSLLFPMIIGIFLLTLQWTMLAWAEATAEAAAQDGARAAALLGGTSAAGRSAALAAATNDSLAGIKARVDRGPITTTATVTGQALTVVPMFPTTITATATVPTERITES